MDLLPKHMCHRCSYKLEEFHKFYVDCLKTDAALKNQLSWMQKGHSKEKIGVPMVHIENVNIKTEPLDYDVYELEPIVKNISYINSMANSVAFPTNGIHDGLAYAAFSRCRCCCDKKDQSRRRTTAELSRNYEKSVSKCSEIAEDSRRRALGDACAKLRPVRRKILSRAMFQNRSQDCLLHVDAAEDARLRLTTANTKDVSSLRTQNLRSHGCLSATPRSQTAITSTIVRNLRPRRNLINYAMNKNKKVTFRSVISESSASRTSDIVEAKTTQTSLESRNSTTDFQLTRQIKMEQIDELEEKRSLRPRKNVVDYHGPKTRKGSESAKRDQRKETELAHRTNRHKLDDVGHSLKLRSRNEDTSNSLKLVIKQEAPDILDNAILDTTTGTTSALPKNRAKILDLSAKFEALATDNGVNLRGSVVSDYLNSNLSQSRNKFQMTQRKSIVNIAKDRMAKSKKINRFRAVNYSPKCLRSQDVYLRNGKVRQYDYMEWSVKRLQKKKLMDVVTKNAKKMPAMMKLTESIKHYCESCNVSFMNKELFRLHECYYD